VRVEEHTIELAGAPVFYRSAPSSSAATPVYLHGAPTSSDDWIPALERTGGLAPDLLGFGRSAKGGHLEYSPEALADFVAHLLFELEIEHFQLVAHGWGAAPAVLLAARYPERVERLVLFNSVPLLPGLTWPWWARMYRTPVLGEVAMGSTWRSILTRWLQAGSATARAWPPPPLEPRPRPWRPWRRPWRRRRGPSPIDRVWEQFDQGTQRAILRLQRSVDEERQRAMADALRSLSMAVLLVWGARDPWWDESVLSAYSAHLPDARVERLADAGHWPWLDEPAAIEQVAAFLEVPPDH
jgi:pimeloyl-ACP methyl ester carboxylesterase